MEMTFFSSLLLLLSLVRSSAFSFLLPSSSSFCLMAAEKLIEMGGVRRMGCSSTNGREKESSRYSCHPSTVQASSNGTRGEEEETCYVSPCSHRISTRQRHNEGKEREIRPAAAAADDAHPTEDRRRKEKYRGEKVVNKRENQKDRRHDEDEQVQTSSST